MQIKRLAVMALFVAALAAPSAEAALYITDPANFGAVLPTSSDCDDCFDGPVAFPGVGQSLNFFGTTYTGGFVGSNGYVTFGAGSGDFSASPLNTQTVGPMVAGLFTDLDSRGDANSRVFVNSATPGQLVVTYADMGHFSQNYSVRSTFQLVIRSDQFVVPPGEGRIGFFYAGVTDANTVSAGFGDGLAAITAGEQAFYSGPGTGLSNVPFRWFNITGGVPTQPPAAAALAIPTNDTLGLALLGAILALAGVLAVRLRSQA